MTNTTDSHVKRAENRINANLRIDKTRRKDTNVYKPVTWAHGKHSKSTNATNSLIHNKNKLN